MERGLPKKQLPALKNNATVFQPPTNLLPPFEPPAPTNPATPPTNVAKITTRPKKGTQPVIVRRTKMPPTKEQNSKYSYSRSFSQNGMSMSARVYHPATNLMPPSPPSSPTGVAPPFSSTRSTNTWGRQNSSNGKYS